ncbi:response regulator [Clostridia bacterium OttesenSCG-928-O13]|nr:response regulator [Clostridia bacterium OttesenSCG-928-O13]
MERYKALIVDDEYAARQTLCRLVDWARFGFDAPVLAENGQVALELYHRSRYDLVFTDIEMPVMNGIQLIEGIRAQNPGQRIVIISCHEKFEYAQRALKLGVEDYLIKDLLTANELSAYLSSFTLEGQAARGAQKAEESDLCGLLREAAGGAALPADAPLGHGAVAVFALVLDEGAKLLVEWGSEGMEKGVSRFLQALEPPAHYYPGGDTVYLAFDTEPNHSTLFYYSNVITLSNAVRTAAKGQGLGRVSIGVSDVCESAAGLAEALRQASEAVQMRILIGPGHTTIHDTIALRKSALDYRKVEYLLDCIRDYSFHANTACLHLIDKLYAITLPNSFADVHYYAFINSRLWFQMLAVAQSQGRQPAEVLRSIGTGIEEVNTMENSREMAAFFKTVFMNLFAEDERPENDNLVNRALRLIEREYARDISLGYVAEQLHTNKSYLSRVFKEQTGDNLMNYITKRKIGRAEYLLQNTHMKLYEISDSLGFASPQYFSTVFKKYSGKSPQEYKKSGGWQPEEEA